MFTSLYLKFYLRLYFDHPGTIDLLLCLLEIYIYVNVDNRPSWILHYQAANSHDNSCTWTHDKRLYIGCTNEPKKSAEQAKEVGKFEFITTGRAYCHILCLIDYIYITLWALCLSWSTSNQFIYTYR